jgi:long-subunit fatty acid transport protein
MLLVGAPVTTQATSVFNMVLLGERLETGDTRSIALGGSTQLISDSLGVLQLNPALLARINKVQIGATQFIGFDQGRSTEFAERDISVLFPTFRLAFPIMGKFVFSFGYMGRYDPDGTFVEFGQTASGVDFLTRFSKTGGLYSIPFTLSFNVSRYAAVGLTYSIENGFVQERWDKEFNALLFAPGAGFKKEEFEGNGYGAGVVLRPTDRIIVGGAFESQIDYDTSVQERFTQPALDTTYVSSATLPARVSVGVTVEATRDVTVAASYAWSDFKDFKGLSFDSNRLSREVSYAVGVEYGKGVKVLGKRFPLRASFNFQELPFAHPVGQQINKFLFGFGTGFLIRDGRGKIDMALQAGQVGAINDNDVEDRVIRVYFSVTGAEQWKRRGGTGSEIGR